MEVTIQQRHVPFCCTTTSSGRTCFDAINGPTNSSNHIQQLQQGDLLVGINGDNVETLDHHSCKALLGTSIRPLRCTFARPTVAVLSKPGALGLSFSTYETRVYIDARPTGQARKEGTIRKGMLLMDVQSTNCAKQSLDNVLALLKSAPRPLYLTFVTASASSGNLQEILCTAQVAEAPSPQKRIAKTPAGRKPNRFASMPKTPAGPRPSSFNGGARHDTVPGPPPKNQSGISVPGAPPRNQTGIVVPGPPPKNQSGISVPGAPPKNQTGIVTGPPDPTPRPTRTRPDPTPRPTRKRVSKERPKPTPRTAKSNRTLHKDDGGGRDGKKPISIDSTVDEKMLVIGLTDFLHSSMGDELNFHEGDVITVEGKEVAKYKGNKSTWINGRIGDKKGTFPKKFTRIVTSPGRELRAANAPQKITQGSRRGKKSGTSSKSNRKNTKNSSSRGSSSNRQPSSYSKPEPKSMKEDTYVNPRGVALTNFDLQDEGDELNFNKDDVIELLYSDDPDWGKGRILGTAGPIGVFPLNFIRRLDDNELKSSFQRIQPVHQKPTPKKQYQPQQYQPRVQEEEEVEEEEEETTTMLGVALHFFRDQSNGDELSFEQGDVITLDPATYQTEDEQWYFGTFKGQEGVFPANFIRITTTKSKSKKLRFGGGSSNNNQPQLQQPQPLAAASAPVSVLSGDTTMMGAKSLLAQLKAEYTEMDEFADAKKEEKAQQKMEKEMLLENQQYVEEERRRLENIEESSTLEAAARLEAVEEERAYLHERMKEQKKGLDEEEQRYGCRVVCVFFVFRVLKSFFNVFLFSLSLFKMQCSFAPGTWKKKKELNKKDWTLKKQEHN